MAVSKEIESEFLPDLGNELTGEQLIFECKVYRANEAFIKLVEEIRGWFNSPVHNKCYPKSRCLLQRMEDRSGKTLTEESWIRANLF